MKPVMFCRKSSGNAALVAQLDEVRALQRRLAEQDAVVGEDPDRMAVDVREAAHERRAVERLELVEARAVDEPRDDLARVVRLADVDRDDAVDRVRVDGRRLEPRSAPTAPAPSGPSVATIERTIASACSSSSARWSVTPDVRECRSPPPSSSAVTSSPVAAFTSGGPPRKIVPCSRTITHSSLIAGTYAPPAVQEPITEAICGIPLRRHRRLVEEDPPEVLAVGEDVVLQRQERAAGVDQVDARQPVVERDLLRAQVLLDRHRVVGAALDGGVVGDDHALAARPRGRRR